MSTYVIIFAVGFICWIIGLLVGFIMRKEESKKVDGILGIDKRGEDKDYYDFVILTPTDKLEQKAYLNIEVKVKR